MCGPPASGKDTLANQKPIVSLDKFRLSVYNGEETGKELYKAAFEYCKNNNINLNNHLIEEIEELFDEKKKMVFVSNTHLTRSLRKSIINSIKNSKKLKDKKISAVYLCCNRKDLYERDIKREDKTVGKQIIDKFIFNQQIPTIDEGFENIIFMEN
jgi:predicted kinase